MRAARLSVALVVVTCLAGCRAPARPAVGIPAGAGPIAAPMIGLDGGTLKPGGQMIGMDGGTIEALGSKTAPAAAPSAAPSATPAAVACDLVAALDAGTVSHPAGQAISLAIDVARGSTVAWAATSGKVLGSGGDAVWEPAGADATITATVTTNDGAATLTWVAATSATGVKLAGPVVTACEPDAKP